MGRKTFPLAKHTRILIGPENLLYCDTSVLSEDLRHHIEALGYVLPHYDRTPENISAIAPHVDATIIVESEPNKKLMLESQHGANIRYDFSGAICSAGVLRGVMFIGTRRSVQQLCKRFVDNDEINGYIIDNNPSKPNHFTCNFVSRHSDFPFHLLITEASD